MRMNEYYRLGLLDTLQDNIDNLQQQYCTYSYRGRQKEVIMAKNSFFQCFSYLRNFLHFVIYVERTHFNIRTKAELKKICTGID